MAAICPFPMIRSLMWRLGRKMYTCARGDGGANDPRTNGEYWLLERVLKKASGPQVLLDVGANKGNWTARAVELSAGANSIHVHAFEPSPATREMPDRPICDFSRRDRQFACSFGRRGDGHLLQQ